MLLSESQVEPAALLQNSILTAHTNSGSSHLPLADSSENGEVDFCYWPKWSKRNYIYPSLLKQLENKQTNKSPDKVYIANNVLQILDNRQLRTVTLGRRVTNAVSQLTVWGVSRPQCREGPQTEPVGFLS